MPKLTIDGHEIEVPSGTTLFQACERLSIEVPHFCYHPRLSVAGNCRMCLVEVEKTPKPVASCAMPIAEGMVVHTNSPMVKKAREGVLELLLINHPLDCPICDQGGECDLQDLTVGYGCGKSHYDEQKRAVTEKYMGPLIKTVMTRCIHCTRCVRFSDEIAGVPEMGAIGRGEHTEITPYLEKAITSELSGNMIDICPVGALTSKPYAFHGRPWELKKVSSIDVLDAIGSNIYVDVRNDQVMRITPRLNNAVNEEWISDRTRFSYDGLSYQRLDRPYIRCEGRLQPASWDDALSLVCKKIKQTDSHRMAALVGPQSDAESIFLLKQMMQALNVAHLDCRAPGNSLPTAHRSHYLFNTSIEKLEEADIVLLIGTNPRIEATLINARLRKTWLQKTLPIALMGPHVDLTYPYTWLGNSSLGLKEDHLFWSLWKTAKRPVVIVGESVFNRADYAAILANIQKRLQECAEIEPGWHPYNVLHTRASAVAALDLRFVPQHGGKSTQEIVGSCQKGDLDFLYLLGVDDLDFSSDSNTFVVYQGHHGDQGARHAHVVLPGAAYTEKEGTYTNLEGRVQRTQTAVPPPGDALPDWQILSTLSAQLGLTPPSTLNDIQRALTFECPYFGLLGSLAHTQWVDLPSSSENLQNTPFELRDQNYYMTDPITRHSPTMAACIREIVQKGSSDD